MFKPDLSVNWFDYKQKKPLNSGLNIFEKLNFSFKFFL